MRLNITAGLGRGRVTRSAGVIIAGLFGAAMMAGAKAAAPTDRPPALKPVIPNAPGYEWVYVPGTNTWTEKLIGERFAPLPLVKTDLTLTTPAIGTPLQGYQVLASPAAASILMPSAAQIAAVVALQTASRNGTLTPAIYEAGMAAKAEYERAYAEAYARSPYSSSGSEGNG